MGTREIILVLCFILATAVEVRGQDDWQPNVTGYSCTVDTSPCQTFLFYRAQAPNYLNLSAISDLFGPSRLQIAKASNLDDGTLYLQDGQLVLVPFTCACMRNYSLFNVTYQIQDGDTFYLLSTITFERLTTYEAVEIANPTEVPTNLSIGVNIVFPIRCKCPTRTQLRNGINMLLTYVVQKGDTLEGISRKYGANLQDLRSQNGMPSTADPNTTLLIPVSKQPELSQPSAPVAAPSPSTQPVLGSSSGGGSKKGVAIGVSIGGVVALVGIAALVIWMQRRRKTPRIIAKESEAPKKSLGFSFGSFPSKKSLQDDLLASVTDCIDKPSVYSIEVIMEATQNFSPLYNIQGSVYKGTIDGRDFAIKQMKGDITEELKILQMVNHANLVKLEGFCISPEGQSYLVYEYADNGSLNAWLHDPSPIANKGTSSSSTSSLPWKTRLQIALDVANGLQYIHEHTTPSVVHKDIKSSNILLDRKFRAKIANFGMARSGINALTKHIVGTQGYISPEYLADGLVTPKVDVFAFGVVLLELISGKEAILREGGVPITGKRGLLWTQIGPILEGEDREEKLKKWIDPVLQTSYPIDSILSIAVLARACVKEDLGARPTIGEIVYKLSKAVEICVDQSDQSFEIPISIDGR